MAKPPVETPETGKETKLPPQHTSKQDPAGDRVDDDRHYGSRDHASVRGRNAGDNGGKS